MTHAELVAYINAGSSLIWPLFFVVVAFLLLRQLPRLIAGGTEVALEFMGNRVLVRPSAKPMAGPSDRGHPGELAPVIAGEALPADYLYLNHTSFLRPEIQDEMQARTGWIGNHYDIRVIVSSYYAGALERVERVEYLLHESYEEPIRTRRSRSDCFLLKEIANGEYVLLARVYLRKRPEPILLQRYLTLWESGPTLPPKDDSER